jgi:hypothetical protein
VPERQITAIRIIEAPGNPVRGAYFTAKDSSAPNKQPVLLVDYDLDHFHLQVIVYHDNTIIWVDREIDVFYIKDECRDHRTSDFLAAIEEYYAKTSPT